MDRVMDILEADEIINKKVQFLINVNDLSNGEKQIGQVIKTENLALDNLVDDNNWSEINDFDFLNIGYGLEVEIEASGDVAVYENILEADNQNKEIGLSIEEDSEEVWPSEEFVNNDDEIKCIVLPEVRVLLDRDTVNNYLKKKEILNKEQNNLNAKYTVIVAQDGSEHGFANLIKLYCKNCDKAYKGTFQNGYQNITNCSSCQNLLVFQCVKCQECSRFFNSMHNHVTTICGQQLNYQCNQCKLTSKNKSRIVNHIKKIHKTVERSGDFECFKCQKRIKYHRNLTRHQKICGVKKGFKCKVCSTRIKNYDDYRNHLQTHFPQSEDKGVFNSNESNVSYKNIKTENVSCNKDFSFYKDVIVHCPTISLQSNISMNVKTEDSFNNVHGGDPELNQETKNKQKKSDTAASKTKHFFCDDCDQRCTTKASLELHIEKIHVKLNIKPDADGNFLCPKCNKKHKGARKFTNHHRSCSLPKVFKCRFCSYRLSKKDYLRTHMTNKHGEVSIEEREEILDEIEKAVTRKLQVNNKNVKVPKKVKVQKLNKEAQKAKKINEQLKKVEVHEEPKKVQEISQEIQKVQKVFEESKKMQTVYEQPIKLERIYKQPVIVEKVYEHPKKEKIYAQPIKVEHLYEQSIKVENIYDRPIMVQNIYDQPFYLPQNLEDLSKEQIMSVIGVDISARHLYDNERERAICYDAY